MLQAGDLVVGEPITLEVIPTNKRYRLSVRYLDRRFVYLNMPTEENGEVASIEPGTEVKLLVTGFGAMYVYTTSVDSINTAQSPPRLVINRTGPPDKQESRANLRLSVQIKTDVKVLAADGSVKGTTPGEMVDVSAGGGRIRLTQPFERDTMIHISFPLAGSAEGIDTKAKIARVFPVIRRGQHEFGLQFLGDEERAITADSVGDRIVKWILDQQRRRVGR